MTISFNTHIHVGHHFFGAGNLGDDLMLAGFLEVVMPRLGDVRLTCCIPHPREPMQARFPQIDWLPYDDAARAQAIGECDVWLGLGDTPFQTVLGDWMLNHLDAEAAWCEAARKPMYFLGVGGDAHDLSLHPKVRRVAGMARHIWTRDRTSAALLRAAAPSTPIDDGADLAHLWLARQSFAPVEDGAAAFVLNFEDPAQFTIGQLAALAEAVSATHALRWLAQEVRPLPGAELTLHAALPPAARALATLNVPDYSGAASVAALVARWGRPQRLLTSRYHAALVGAWAGCATLVYPRSAKVRAAADELGLTLIESLADARAVRTALERAAPASIARLQQHAARARASCDAFVDIVSRRRPN